MMRNFKKWVCLLMALAVIASLPMAAYAAESGDGTITVSNAVAKQTYSIFRIFDLSFSKGTNGGEDAYTYIVNSSWAAFINSADIKDVYITVNPSGAISFTSAKNDEDGAAEFAKLAIAYAKEHGIAPKQTMTNETEAEATLTFSNLPLGYYLIDSSIGTLCVLDTTNPSVSITDKNPPPTMKKEDVTPADVIKQIGNDVDYQVTIDTRSGALNYILHDTMDKGLTFKADSLAVTLNGALLGTDKYTMTTNPEDGHTVDIAFHENLCNTLTDTDKLVVTYKVTINADAVIDDIGNKNDAYLSYGRLSQQRETEPSRVTTYVYRGKIYKYTGNLTGTNTPLAGAGFTIATEPNGLPLKMTKVDGTTVPTYKLDPDGTITEILTDSNGRFEIAGLGETTYYMKETTVPSGYNALVNEVVFRIKGSVDETGKATTIIETPNDTDTEGWSSVAEVSIQNNSGVELPHTGGTGTKLLYAIGGTMFVGAIVLLITKKRMSKFDT